VAKFRNDGNFDPKFAEFQQNVADYVEFTGGSKKSQKPIVTSMHDDGYSRKDDKKHKYTDVDFVQSDSPGFKNFAELAADDELFYVFTAEQLIKDSRTGAEILKVGPRSASGHWRAPAQEHPDKAHRPHGHQAVSSAPGSSTLNPASSVLASIRRTQRNSGGTYGDD